MNKYKIEDNIDFYEELMKEEEENENANTNVCLLTGLPLIGL
jgi:hypothetical protein